MPMIAVNGVVLPVKMDSLQMSEEVVGSTMRNAHGWALRDRRATKRTLSFELTPKTLEEAMLYRSLITGEGEFWSMASSVYGAKGLAITGTGSLDTSTSAVSAVSWNGKGAWKLDPGETMVAALPMPTQMDVGGVSLNPGANGSSFVGWVWNATAAEFYLFAWSWGPRDTTPAVKREFRGGSAQAYSGTETFTASATQLQVTAPGSGGPWYYSGMLWLPRRFKATQLDALTSGIVLNSGLNAPPLPRVLVKTDLFPADLAGNGITDTRTFVALGDVKMAAVVPVWRSGAFDPSSLSMAVELVEV